MYSNFSVPMGTNWCRSFDPEAPLYGIEMRIVAQSGLNPLMLVAMGQMVLQVAAFTAYIPASSYAVCAKAINRSFSPLTACLASGDWPYVLPASSFLTA